MNCLGDRIALMILMFPLGMIIGGWFTTMLLKRELKKRIKEQTK